MNQSCLALFFCKNSGWWFRDKNDLFQLKCGQAKLLHFFTYGHYAGLCHQKIVFYTSAKLRFRIKPTFAYTCPSPFI
jgi:hypothetical protein